mmetsp:Transcript_2370/g.6413  ORF Transcript_2370/g.6413 Transcript_2370/m.6413 type:complete len:159 (+) Transcript_2370:336-812(+)
MVAFRDPGVLSRPDLSAGDYPMTEPPETKTVEENEDEAARLVDNAEQQPVRWCAKCGVHNKLPFGHCYMCNQCIDGFSHHCGWVGKCIGSRNRIPFQIYAATAIIALILFWGESLILCLRVKETHDSWTEVAALQPMPAVFVCVGVMFLCCRRCAFRC